MQMKQSQSFRPLPGTMATILALLLAALFPTLHGHKASPNGFLAPEKGKAQTQVVKSKLTDLWDQADQTMPDRKNAVPKMSSTEPRLNEPTAKLETKPVSPSSRETKEIAKQHKPDEQTQQLQHPVPVAKKTTEETNDKNPLPQKSNVEPPLNGPIAKLETKLVSSSSEETKESVNQHQSEEPAQQLQHPVAVAKKTTEEKHESSLPKKSNVEPPSNGPNAKLETKLVSSSSEETKESVNQHQSDERTEQLKQPEPVAEKTTEEKQDEEDNTLQTPEQAKVLLAAKDTVVESDEPRVQVLALGLQEEDADKSSSSNKGALRKGIEVEVVRKKTEMLMPTNQAVKLLPDMQKSGSASKSKCICPQGKFLDWKSKECVEQKSVRAKCGMYPTIQRNRVCQDGLTCKLAVSRDKFTSGKIIGETTTSEVECAPCESGDDCKSGEERHNAECVRMKELEEDMQEQEEDETMLQPLEKDDVFEAWGGKVGKISDGDALGDDKTSSLKPFGRAEPKMCVTVQVTLPKLTMEEKAAKTIILKINTTLELAVNASETASASAQATAKRRQHAKVEVEATASAKQKATATAEARYTAYAVASATDEATYKAEAKAQVSRDVPGTGHRAKIVTEASAKEARTAKVSAEVVGNATAKAVATETETVEITLTKKGAGEADAEVEKSVEVTADYTETVRKTKNVDVVGVGSLSNDFEATASAKAVVQVRSCIAANEARRLLSDEEMDQSGKPFAKLVYKKAEREAFAQAKHKGMAVALDAATETVKTELAKDIKAQIEKFTKDHEEELKTLAMKSAAQKAEGDKKELKAAASAEARKVAEVKVQAVAESKAKKAADRQAKLAAEDEATRKAKAQAEDRAREGLKARAWAKAKTQAQKKANEKAKAAALQLAQEKAEKLAQERAEKEAAKVAQKRAKEAAMTKAKKAATEKAASVAEDMAEKGSAGVKKDHEKNA
eukprot:TRINITY_DN166_c0_g1_i1.p1 TRINITY_DN166_c0_g1~~TRINITY_DN166_c0_g1_i1.p1  ORF type:complete len:961 (+),score=302.66 TRINITY_DN166_c0_g1_i1:30-2912(+)